jgi:hypothetical protein
MDRASSVLENKLKILGSELVDPMYPIQQGVSAMQRSLKVAAQNRSRKLQTCNG